MLHGGIAWNADHVAAFVHMPAHMQVLDSQHPMVLFSSFFITFLNKTAKVAVKNRVGQGTPNTGTLYFGLSSLETLASLFS